MKISLIAAVAEKNVIGAKNDMLWHLPADMKHFKEITMGHHVLMGRKTYESIPDKFMPLPGRTNLVVTRKKDYEAPGCHVFNSVSDAIDFAYKSDEDELFVIGGGGIYKYTIGRADTLYITEVMASLEGDTFFPELNHDHWKEVKREKHDADERHPYDYSFVVYQKVQEFVSK